MIRLTLLESIISRNVLYPFHRLWPPSAIGGGAAPYYPLRPFLPQCFCFRKNSVIGMKYDTSLKRLITSINERFDVEDKGEYVLNACEIDFINNSPADIRRISFVYSFDEEHESED